MGKLPAQSRNEAVRLAQHAETAGVLNQEEANPRWLPGPRRVAECLRSVSSPHRMHTDEQRSFFALAESLLLTDQNPTGTVLFIQSQICCCYDVDVDEQRLSLERRIRSARQLAHSRPADIGDAAAQQQQQQQQQLLAALETELADLGAGAAAPAAKVSICILYGSLCSSYLHTSRTTSSAKAV